MNQTAPKQLSPAPRLSWGPGTILIGIPCFFILFISGLRLQETIAAFEANTPAAQILAVVMALFMLSLAGVPPMVGFMAKLYVFGAAVQAGLIWLAVFGVINSVVSAYYYLRVVVVMFMKEGEQDQDTQAPVCLALQVGLGIAAAAIVVLGFWPAPILDLARQAATAFLGG